MCVLCTFTPLSINYFKFGSGGWQGRSTLYYTCGNIWKNVVDKVRPNTTLVDEIDTNVVKCGKCMGFGETFSFIHCSIHQKGLCIPVVYYVMLDLFMLAHRKYHNKQRKEPKKYHVSVNGGIWFHKLKQQFMVDVTLQKIFWPVKDKCWPAPLSLKQSKWLHCYFSDDIAWISFEHHWYVTT